MKIYLAGPEVFLPEARRILAEKSALAREYGFTPLAPGDNILELTASRFERGLQISGFDEALMDKAEGIIANLTPFRGIGADPGTCFELGYMCAQGKAAFAYTNDPTDHYARIVRHHDGVITRGADGRPYDPEGLSLEDFDMADNLMLIGGVVRRGGSVVVHEAARAGRYTDLTGFREALRLMAAANL